MGARQVLEAILFPRVALDPARLRERLAGKTVLITGASFGIGEDTARLLGAAGARVILVARTADKLELVAQAVRAEGGEALTIPTDMTDGAAVDALAARVLELGGADILLNNAGKSIRRSLWLSLDRFHDITRTIGVNYLGPARLTLALIPDLRRRAGQIVNISAANVLLPSPAKWAAYQASKSAFDQWLRCAGPELRAAGVAVTHIYLPLVRTRMIAPTAHYADVPAMAPEQVARLLCRAMLGRWLLWTPWWLPISALAAKPFRRTWEVVSGWQARRDVPPETAA